jgi:hypothetical protein
VGVGGRRAAEVNVALHASVCAVCKESDAVCVLRLHSLIRVRCGESARRGMHEPTIDEQTVSPRIRLKTEEEGRIRDEACRSLRLRPPRPR